MKFLVSTDNHLGCFEKDPIRCNDSYDTFEEILKLAHTHNVDAILFGGDLFHDNKPSRAVIYRTIELLRKYCMGSKKSFLNLLCDPSEVFSSQSGTANYLDPNYNVSIPAFIIHGNHDDPTGDGNLSTIDILSAAGLVNYFGKTSTVDDIKVAPILLEKDGIKLALYGIGAIRDERLYRTFLQHKVSFLRPPPSFPISSIHSNLHQEEDSSLPSSSSKTKSKESRDGNNESNDQQVNDSEWFNILILHQNRVAHGPTNYIPESFIDDFFDLVIWGHEHDCQLGEEMVIEESGRSVNGKKKFTVCQPGSSVATSLCEGESKKKHVVLFKLSKDDYELEPIPLSTTRSFVMREIVLRDIRPPFEDILDEKVIFNFLIKQVESMIKESNSSISSSNQSIKSNRLPLIRLKVDYGTVGRDGFYTTFPIINPQRFGQFFVGRVANPRDILSVMRSKRPSSTKNKVIDPSKNPSAFNNGPAIGSLVTAAMGEGHYHEQSNSILKVEDLVSHYLQSQTLDLIPQNEFSDVVKYSVEKDDKDAIEAFIKTSVERSLKSIQPNLISEGNKQAIFSEMERIRKEREKEWERLHHDHQLSSHQTDLNSIKKIQQIHLDKTKMAPIKSLSSDLEDEEDNTYKRNNTREREIDEIDIDSINDMTERGENPLESSFPPTLLPPSNSNSSSFNPTAITRGRRGRGGRASASTIANSRSSSNKGVGRRGRGGNSTESLLSNMKPSQLTFGSSFNGNSLNN